MTSIHKISKKIAIGNVGIAGTLKKIKVFEFWCPFMNWMIWAPEIDEIFTYFDVPIKDFLRSERVFILIHFYFLYTIFVHKSNGNGIKMMYSGWTAFRTYYQPRLYLKGNPCEGLSLLRFLVELAKSIQYLFSPVFEFLMNFFQTMRIFHRYCYLRELKCNLVEKPDGWLTFLKKSYYPQGHQSLSSNFPSYLHLSL